MLLDATELLRLVEREDSPDRGACFDLGQLCGQVRETIIDRARERALDAWIRHKVQHEGEAWHCNGDPILIHAGHFGQTNEIGDLRGSGKSGHERLEVNRHTGNVVVKVLLEEVERGLERCRLHGDEVSRIMAVAQQLDADAGCHRWRLDIYGSGRRGSHEGRVGTGEHSGVSMLAGGLPFDAGDCANVMDRLGTAGDEVALKRVSDCVEHGVLRHNQRLAKVEQARLGVGSDLSPNQVCLVLP